VTSVGTTTVDVEGGGGVHEKRTSRLPTSPEPYDRGNQAARGADLASEGFVAHTTGIHGPICLGFDRYAGDGATDSVKRRISAFTESDRSSALPGGHEDDPVDFTRPAKKNQGIFARVV